MAIDSPEKQIKRSLKVRNWNTHSNILLGKVCLINKFIATLAI